jgi:hypothetical protein
VQVIVHHETLHNIVLAQCCRIWASINMTAFNVVIFLMIISHLQAVLSDPGTVPLPKTSLDFSDLHAGQKLPKVR